jgi:hypothetical protein
MFKKLGLAIVIALAFCFTGFAKTNVNLGKGFVSSISDNEELIKQLAADQDFKNYYISNVEFANKIVETKSGSLFYKYIQNKISEEEQNLLFKQMNVADKKEFDGITIKRVNVAKTIAKKFPSLQSMTAEESKFILKAALKKSAEDKKAIKLKILNANPQECFYTWVTCTTLCFIGCNSAENFSDCMLGCESFCSGVATLCWFIEE